MSKITFVYPIIRTDYIEDSIASLVRHTFPGDFKIVVIDQTIDGMDANLKANLFNDGHVYIRQKNEGFSNAANKGIVMGLQWQTPYIAVVNDDTRFMYSGWLDDALEEFETDPQIVAVCPESPRVAGWGYGLSPDKYIELLPFKESYTPQEILYLKSGNYDKEEVTKRHDFAIPATFPFHKRGVVDGIAMWLPIFKREAFIELGLFDERFVWGGGEDYDFLARSYSCGYPIPRDICDPRFHRRMVSTMKSWVWHHWGQSKDIKSTLDPKLFAHKKPWNDAGSLWTPQFDVWGHYTENGIRKPIKRTSPVFIEKG